ncbi:MAG TPA: UvrD-helicase domain-containing protein [Anaerolineae bacterium]|nr:UvrD-helicase domain-containing protein [Anaerolineae bacterium]
MFQPRPAQQKILEYLGLGGKMGVSAVPGSGKTVTLSYLAAQLVKEKIRGDEEVLIVTFANSAVDHFTRRIREFLQPDASARPDAGYRVRTLHGLAHDILRERPTLLGLPEDFDIVDERVSTQLLEDLVANWLRVSGVGGDASRRRLTLEELASGGSASGGSASGDASYSRLIWTLDRVLENFPQLAQRLKHLGAELSGGEQQMLAIARALMTNPTLLLMDEPSEGLAPLIVKEIGRMLNELRMQGLSILLVEQNLALALSVADRVYVMSKGRIVFEGTPSALRADQETLHRYLGV